MKPAKKRRRSLDINTNIIDRAVAFFSPVRGARRFKARAFMALAGGYLGASKSRRGLKAWSPYGSDPDSAILADLPALRERSRDLIRNSPLAVGALQTKITNVVGSGLTLQSRIDRDALGMDDETADAWEAKTEREWRLFWDSKDVDITRQMNGDALTALVYRQAKENGDVFTLLPRIQIKDRPYKLRLQVIEADRVSNEKYKRDSEKLAGGIKRDKHGAPTEYQILQQHPGNRRFVKGMKWKKVPAFGRTLGLRNVIHLFLLTRPGQSRGVPDLAAVIEPLKQLDRYTEAEIMAAVVSGMFTVFIETESGESRIDLTDLGDETGAESTDTDYKLASGSIVGLAKGEKVHDTNPGRPNTSFDPFVMSVLRQIGVALQLPFEILIKHFTRSYSAARAAIEEAYKYFLTERKWLADNFNQLIYEIWMFEAVAAGRIAAPGFLADPATRAAYLESEWIGPPKSQIDELKEVKAARERVDGGFSNRSRECLAMTGTDWQTTHRQQVKENEARKKDGLADERQTELTPEPKDDDE